MSWPPLALLLLAVAGLAFAGDAPPPRSVEQIRREMTALRRSTDWGNAAAARAANEKLAQLAEEMLRASRRPRAEDQASAAHAAAGNTADPNADGLDVARLQRQMTTQAAAAVAGGPGAAVRLAETARTEIAAKYAADVDPTIRCPEVFTAQTVLVIDFSSPAADAVVGQMENFRGITTLVLTGGAAGAPGDLDGVLRKARHYPLRELYIIGFRGHVTALPAGVAAFPDLRLLAAFRNGLTALPAELAGLQHLETLYVDLNPLPSVLPVVRGLPRLARLGVGQTEVPPAELAEIRRLLPRCEVLTQ